MTTLLITSTILGGKESRERRGGMDGVFADGFLTKGRLRMNDLWENVCLRKNVLFNKERTHDT